MRRYLERHWCGELPLGVAWWLNGLALTVASLLAPGALANAGWLPEIDTSLRYTAWVLAGLAGVLLIPAWQVIGLYRAGENQLARAGTVVAGHTIQVATTLLALLLAMRALAFAGEAYSGARVAYPWGGPATITVSHGGRLLEVESSFRFGLAEEVAAALERHPGVRRLRLTSGGGSLSEAIKLRGLIEARGLDTDAASLCASACVSAYMAGRQRLAHRRALLGFHLPRNSGFGLRSVIAPFYAEELAWFGRRGVPRWFRERWIAGGRAFWYPSPRQLRAASIVTAFYGQPAAGEEFRYR
jgi:hypothetical protein